MVVVAGRVRVKPESRDAAMKAAMRVVQTTKAEPGCRMYDFYTDIADPNIIHVFEEWESEEALNQHLQAAHTQEFLQQLPQFLAGETTLTRYWVASSESLL